jgi:hypothetical protein
LSSSEDGMTDTELEEEKEKKERKEGRHII